MGSLAVTTADSQEESETRPLFLLEQREEKSCPQLESRRGRHCFGVPRGLNASTRSIPSSQLELGFFNDEPATSVSREKGNQVQIQQFQLRVTREESVLALVGLWCKTHNALTEQKAGQSHDTFVDLLNLINQQPQLPVRDLLGPLPHDLDQIWSWNAILPPTIDRIMRDIISEQAAARPDKVALASWDGHSHTPSSRHYQPASLTICAP
ncbi:hypothetical protein VTK56DRAFT_2398 [Thermocarpiscus australiensis]